MTGRYVGRMPDKPVRRVASAVLLSFALAGAVGACTETEEPEEDAPSQQAPAPAPAPGGEEQDDDG